MSVIKNLDNHNGPCLLFWAYCKTRAGLDWTRRWVGIVICKTWSGLKSYMIKFGTLVM